MNTADKIKRLRKSKGLSLKEMATLIGVSDMSLSKLETGKTKSITIDLGKGIAKALNISFNELFNIEYPIMESGLVEKLQYENEALKQQLENYQLLISLLKSENERLQNNS